jgi:hypothetical protein
VFTSAVHHRDRRALRLGMAVVAALLVLLKGVPAVDRWTRESRASAEELRTELSRARNAVEGKLQRRALTLAAGHEVAARAAWLVAGTNASAASGSLVALIASAAEQSETTLGTVRPDMEHRTIGGFSRVRARADATGDLETIAVFLAALEEGPERLIVRELELSIAVPPPPQQRELLRLSAVVEGLARASVPESATTPSTTR